MNIDSEVQDSLKLACLYVDGLSDQITEMNMVLNNLERQLLILKEKFPEAFNGKTD